MNVAEKIKSEIAAANDNHVDEVAALREYKKTIAGSTGDLRRVGGKLTLVGCIVGDEPGNAVVAPEGHVTFTRTAEPIAVLNGRALYLSESDIAVVFSDRYRDALRFDHTAGAWFEWTGSHWKRCETGLALHLARELCYALSAGAKTKEAVATRRKAFASGVEGFCRVVPDLAVTATEWDADHFLLGTPGGTVDLRTGALRPADPNDMISKVTGITPSAEEDCPLWLRFLKEATGENEDLIVFLKRWAGYCLTGSVKEHALVFIFGPGGNGKSVFINLLIHIAGDYATVSPMDTFTASNSDRHPTDLARLNGARLVTASETEEGRGWDEAKIKSLTGGDPVSARFMRQDFFTFHPQFKLSIVGNHLPTLRNVTDAVRRRFNIVPFTIKPKTVDRDLEAKLHGEAAGILRWAINGCLEWQRDGLGQPKAVAEATEDYFAEQDIFSKWLEDSCRVERDNPHLFATTEELFRNWSDYAVRVGEKAGTETAFGRRMTAANFEKKRLLKRGFAGIELKKLPQRDAD